MDVEANLAKWAGMNRNRVKWEPHSEKDREIVNEALEKILASPQFRNSKRYPDFLRYVVHQVLDGDTDQIKERTLGIEVFGRTADYDTSADTVVRYTAGEVRKRLGLYYSETPDAKLQIAFPPRSYHPEFYEIVDPKSSIPAVDAAEDLAEIEQMGLAQTERYGSWTVQRKVSVCFACIFLGIAVSWVGQWVWMMQRAEAENRFWSLLTRTNQPVLIATGGVMFPPPPKNGTDANKSATEYPYLSFESALAMGRITALLTSREREYRIEPAASVNLAQMRENSVVLIGAYNNPWTERLLKPLRFHFVDHPAEAIVDTWHPEKQWSRDWSKPSTDSPDYGLVARFRDPSTGGPVVVIAGLQRFGTDAASEFAVSSHFLDLLDRQFGSNWKSKNIEVVLRVDVVQGRAGAPIIEAIHEW